MEQRKWFLDKLRLLSVVAVIMLHITWRGEATIEVSSLQWSIYSVISSSLRWCVPVFVMISGALFLDPNKKVTVKDLYFKYIKRLFIAYVVWSFVYSLLFSTLPNYSLFSKQGISDLLFNTVKGGYYHLWYLVMLIGIYMLIPILKTMTANDNAKKIIEYFLIVGTIIIFGISLLTQSSFINSLFGSNLETINVGFFGVYVWYYVLGYYLTHFSFSKKIKIIIYIGGIIGLLISVICTCVFSYFLSKEFGYFRDAGSFSVMLMSMGLFLFFKEKRNRIKTTSERKKRLLLKLSKLTFGIYLVHEIVLSSFCDIIIANLPLWLSKIVLLVLTFTVSLIIVILLDLIKPLSKYIV